MKVAIIDIRIKPCPCSMAVSSTCANKNIWYTRFDFYFAMQDLLLPANPMLLGLIGINTIALVSLLGFVVSHRGAVNRLEQALSNSRLALPEERFADLLKPAIEDDEPLASAGVEIADAVQADESKPQVEVVVFS